MNRHDPQAYLDRQGHGFQRRIVEYVEARIGNAEDPGGPETIGLLVYDLTYDDGGLDDPASRITRRYATVGARGGGVDGIGFDYSLDVDARRERERREDEARAAVAARDVLSRAEKIRATVAGHALEPEQRPRCPNCAEIVDDDVEPLYACSRCGSNGYGADERRCDQCGIFRAKEADAACPSCQQAIDEWPDVEQVDGYDVPGIGFVTLDDYENLPKGATA